MPNEHYNDSDKNSKNNEIRVVCAGLGRTGTLSLKEALEILGYNPYHYIDFDHASEWADLADGKCKPGDVLDRIVLDKKGYDVLLENPTCDIFDDVLNRFPEAKIILTVRDSKEKFEASWKVLMETMVVTEKDFRWTFPTFFGWIPLFQRLKRIRAFMGTTHLGLPEGALAHGWRDRPNGWLGEQYERHNQHVIDVAAARNQNQQPLLVFNVKEGWEPLCAFLGCEVPKNDDGGALPFPHSQVNTKESLQSMKRTFLAAVYGWIPATFLASAGAALFVLGRQQKVCALGSQQNR